jgi:hypothetical protein
LSTTTSGEKLWPKPSDKLRWIDAAVADQRLSPERLRFLLVLRSKADDRGECYWSISKLAKLIGRSESLVSMHITELKAAGWLATFKMNRFVDGRLTRGYVKAFRLLPVPPAAPDPTDDEALSGAESSEPGLGPSPESPQPGLGPSRKSSACPTKSSQFGEGKVLSLAGRHIDEPVYVEPVYEKPLRQVAVSSAASSSAAARAERGDDAGDDTARLGLLDDYGQEVDEPEVNQVLAAFDRWRAAWWPDAGPRNPVASDRPTARQWLKAGMPPEGLEFVFMTKLQKRSEAGESPSQSLRHLHVTVEEATAAYLDNMRGWDPAEIAAHRALVADLCRRQLQSLQPPVTIGAE